MLGLKTLKFQLKHPISVWCYRFETSWNKYNCSNREESSWKMSGNKILDCFYFLDIIIFVSIIKIDIFTIEFASKDVTFLNFSLLEEINPVLVVEGGVGKWAKRSLQAFSVFQTNRKKCWGQNDWCFNRNLFYISEIFNWDQYRRNQMFSCRKIGLIFEKESK